MTEARRAECRGEVRSPAGPDPKPEPKRRSRPPRRAEADRRRPKSRPVVPAGSSSSARPTTRAKPGDPEQAKTQSQTALAKAYAFTEKVCKGGSTLYRARFSGFDEDNAQSACKSLKRDGFACFAMNGRLKPAADSRHAQLRKTARLVQGDR